MAIERILPIDWSTNPTTSDHTNITNYQNALTNVDSTTYGQWSYWSSDGSTIIVFDKNDLPQNARTVSFKIKTSLEWIPGFDTVSLQSVILCDGDYYMSDPITTNNLNTITTYTLPLPSGISPARLKYSQLIFIGIITTAQVVMDVYGAEIDADTTTYKIFNLILPAKEKL